jgi:thiol-disulfide isomerase/thioredoxin
MKKGLIALLVIALLVIPAIRTLHRLATEPVAGEQMTEKMAELKFAYIGEAPAEGGKITLIEFWATWCGPCIDSIPSINRLHTDYASRGLTIVAVSDEERTVVERFIKRRKINYAMALDVEGKLHQTFQVESIPFAVLLDENQRILWSGNPSDLDHALLEKHLPPAGKVKTDIKNTA